MKKIFVLLTLSIAIFSCKKDGMHNGGVFKGPETTAYQGKAWTTAKVDGDGAPTSLSISLRDDILTNVASIGEIPGQENDVEIPLPVQALAATPFKFVMIDWNPNGHPPAGIYDKPHFDFHFYMRTQDEVMTYTDTAKLNAEPSAEYLPVNYLGVEPVPQMGKHFVDVTSPEFNGGGFTQTFIYGSYDAQVAFYEPMVTLAFLKSTTQFDRTIPQPQKFQKAGYYPTKFHIVKHDGVTEIILDGFIHRTAS